MATITNAVKLFTEHRINGIITLKRNVNSNNARRKLDERAEVPIIEIACSSIQDGRFCLLEEHAKMVLDVPEVKIPLAEF